MIKTNASNAMSQDNKPSNTSRAEAALAEVLQQAMRRGFYGSAGLVLSVQDGHIQHVRLTVDRMIK